MEENLKFKKGDKVRYKTNPSEVYTVDMVCDDHYTLDVEGECVILPFINQDLWELADIIEDLGISREDYTKIINECIFGEEEPLSEETEKMIDETTTKVVEGLMKQLVNNPLEEEIKNIQRRYKTIEEYDGQYAPLYASDIEYIARHFADWQKVKDQFQIDMAHDSGYMEGQDYARRQITEAKPLSNLRRALTHKFYEASKRIEVKEIGDPSEVQDIFDMVNNLDEICSYFGYKYDFEEGIYKLNENKL